MKVSINIQGAGTVTGDGEYASRDIISLEATPLLNMSFKQFNINGIAVKSNPYSITAESTDLSITAIFYMSALEWLKSQTQYPVTDNEVAALLYKRGISFDADLNEIERRLADLSYADLLMLIVTSPSYGAEEEQMGNWKSKGKSVTMTGKSQLLSMANAIYERYGERKSSFKIIDKTYHW